MSWPWCRKGGGFLVAYHVRMLPTIGISMVHSKVFLRVLLVVRLALVLVLLVLCVQLRFLPQGRVHSGSPEVGFAQHC